MNITVIYGSVRSARKGIRAAKYIVQKCEERGNSVTLIDPAEYELPLIDKMFKEYPSGEAPPPLAELSKILSGSDGFIIVSGEYNHTIPPALTNLMDYFQKEYHFKPSAIMSYSAGSFGGIRAAIHLRAFLSELGTPSIPSLFPVPKIQEAFDKEGNPADERFDKRTKKFLDEFEWYAEALKNRRESGTPY